MSTEPEGAIWVMRNIVDGRTFRKYPQLTAAFGDAIGFKWLMEQGYVELWGKDLETAVVMTTYAGREWFKARENG